MGVLRPPPPVNPNIMSKRTLDLDSIINAYDEVKVGDKTYKISKLKTSTLFKIEKLVQDNKDVAGADVLSEQVHTILLQDNPDVTIEDIKKWGIEAQAKFLNWFMEPFLELAAKQKAAKVEDKPAELPASV